MDILETIIRGVLLEAPVTKAKLRSFSSAELLAAKRATPVGAVFGYYAIVKGVANDTALLNAVAGATMGSQDSDTRVGVGAAGPYANGKFLYVVNTDDVQRKNVAAVWIIPNDPATGVKPTTALKIGQSPMISKAEYVKLSDAAKAADPNAQVADVSQMPENETRLQQLFDKGKDIFTKDKEGEDDQKEKDQTVKDDSKPLATGYPRDVEGVKVYTMADTDDYVYAKINGRWKFIEKTAFEANPKLAVITKKLNAAGIKNVETKFGLSSGNNNNNNNNGGDNPTPDPVIQQDKIRTIQKGNYLEWNRKAGTDVIIYNWNGSKFVQVKDNKGNPQAWEIDDEKAMFIKEASNKKYFEVKLGGEYYFIDKRYFKEVNIQAPLKSGDTLKWTNKALTDGVPTYNQGGASPTGQRKTVKATDKIVFVSKNNKGTFYEVKWNGTNIWIPKSYLTQS
jgi:hypothetical protein